MKKSWDDIPPLEGLEVEWDFEPENPLGRRVCERMSGDALASLFKSKKKPVNVVSEIPVHIATMNGQFPGTIFDISEGGLAIDSSSQLAENQMVKVGFFLGQKKIVSKAVVRWVTQIGTVHRSGMMFVDLSQENFAFIAGIYASKKITRV